MSNDENLPPADESGQLQLDGMLPDGREPHPDLRRALELSMALEQSVKPDRRTGATEVLTEREEVQWTLIRNLRTGAITDVEDASVNAFFARLVKPKFKDILGHMGVPIYSLDTTPDMSSWRWDSPDKRYWFEVNPSGKGRATIYDKKILTYITSAMMVQVNKWLKGEGDPPPRVVRLSAYDFLTAIGDDTSKTAYRRFLTGLDRLQGTQIKTNLHPTDDGLSKEKAHGLIADYEIDRRMTDTGPGKLLAVYVELSRWHYQQLVQEKVLTLSEAWVNLTKPLEILIYELGRKHLGDKTTWTISEEKLYVLAGYAMHGARTNKRQFRSYMSAIHATQNLPDFTVDPKMSGSERQWVFTKRNGGAMPITRGRWKTVL